MPWSQTDIDWENLLQRITTIEGNVSGVQGRLVRWSPTNEDRALDNVFNIGNTTPVLVIYTIELEVQAGLLSAQDVTVALLHDTNDTPVTQSAQVYLRSEQMLGLTGLGIQTGARQNLIGLIQPGENVLLASSGSGTPTLIQSIELILTWS